MERAIEVWRWLGTLLNGNKGDSVRTRHACFSLHLVHCSLVAMGVVVAYWPTLSNTTLH